VGEKPSPTSRKACKKKGKRKEELKRGEKKKKANVVFPHYATERTTGKIR